MTADQRAQVSALKAAGMTQREIAERLGVVKSTVSRALNPDTAREYNAAYRRARRSEIRRQQADYREARRAGEPIASEREPPPFYRFLAELERA